MIGKDPATAARKTFDLENVIRWRYSDTDQGEPEEQTKRIWE